ncbi:MAG: DUF1097 domain-containing protein [Eubacteriaceae bacterium]|jgi:hypothetical protein
MRINRIDISVAVFSGLACLGLLCDIPVWALFIGWTWYVVLGNKPSAFGKVLPAMAMGYLMAGVSVITYEAFHYNIWSLVIAVGVTSLMLMYSFKIPFFNCSMAAFNAYSCMFAGYYTGSFPASTNVALYDINNVIRAILWIAMANLIGMCIGWLSTYIGELGTKKDEDPED